MLEWLIGKFAKLLPKGVVDSNSTSDSTNMNNQGIFALLQPFPAPTGVGLLLWSRNGWFIGEWDGKSFKEDGTGFSFEISKNVNKQEYKYLILPR